MPCLRPFRRDAPIPGAWARFSVDTELDSFNMITRARCASIDIDFTPAPSQLRAIANFASLHAWINACDACGDQQAKQQKISRVCKCAQIFREVFFHRSKAPQRAHDRLTSNRKNLPAQSPLLPIAQKSQNLSAPSITFRPGGTIPLQKRGRRLAPKPTKSVQSRNSCSPRCGSLECQVLVNDCQHDVRIVIVIFIITTDHGVTSKSSGLCTPSRLSLLK